MSQSILDQIVSRKRKELEDFQTGTLLRELRGRLADAPPTRSFCAPLRRRGVQLIAEIKKASPSAGLIRADFDPPHWPANTPREERPA